MPGADPGFMIFSWHFEQETLSCVISNPRLGVAVTDTGIPADSLNTIFDELQLGSRSQKKHKGTGQGLSHTGNVSRSIH